VRSKGNQSEEEDCCNERIGHQVRSPSPARTFVRKACVDTTDTSRYPFSFNPLRYQEAHSHEEHRTNQHHPTRIQAERHQYLPE
jgi:hypothetical protein